MSNPCCSISLHVRCASNTTCEPVCQPSVSVHASNLAAHATRAPHAPPHLVQHGHVEPQQRQRALQQRQQEPMELCTGSMSNITVDSMHNTRTSVATCRLHIQAAPPPPARTRLLEIGVLDPEEKDSILDHGVQGPHLRQTRVTPNRPHTELMSVPPSWSTRSARAHTSGPREVSLSYIASEDALIFIMAAVYSPLVGASAACCIKPPSKFHWASDHPKSLL